MRIGILADTHDAVPATRRAIEIFQSAGVDRLIHCGDYVAPPTVDELDEFPVDGVLGNNDGEIQGLTAAFDALGSESSLHGRFADITVDNHRFAILHGESMSEVTALAQSHRYDYVCYGHHHEQHLETVGETTIINPGALYPTVPAEEQSVAVVDTVKQSVEHFGVST